MIDNLGESGKLVVGYARRIAANLRHEDVRPEHLFLAVGDLEDLGIRRCLLDAGLDIDEACVRIRKRIRRGEALAPGELGLTPEARASLERAQRAASAMGQKLVEAPHIVAGLLDDDEGMVAQVLDELGIDRKAVRQGLTGLVESQGWTPSPWDKGRPNIEQAGLTRSADVLESLGRDLTAAAEEHKLNAIVGRDDEIAQLVTILLGHDKTNALLIGEAGVGKTAIVEGLAQRIVDGTIPQLAGMRIRTIEVGSLVAGTIYRGQFEQRMKDLIDGVRNRDDVILFIDEMHMLVGAGETGMGGSVDAANMLKPVLTEGTLKVIGATTIDEYRKYLERATALMRRFETIVVNEPSRDDALTILSGARATYEEFHVVTIADEAIAAAVDLSGRYIHDRFLPDKAFDLLDRACTQKKLEAGTRRGEEPPGERPIVSADDIAEVVSVMIEVPIARLTQSEQERVASLAGMLKRRVFDQDRAVDAVAAAIARVRSGVERPSKRPIGVFLFLGPTGVGKTKLAEELAVALFGDENRLIRLDMSQYADEHTKSDLIGVGPGYVGWEEGGKLTNAVRRNPYAVVLLDEIEKAHPTVWNLFLQVFDNGQMTDGLDRLIDFRNTIIIMTSNVGARYFEARFPTGFSAHGPKTTFSDVEHDVLEELKRTFTPEFLNRIDEVIVFRALSLDAIRRIVKQQAGDMVRVDLAFSGPALEFLVRHSYNPSMGARPVRRAIQRFVSNPLSKLLLAGGIAADDHVRVGYSKRRDALTFRRADRPPTDHPDRQDQPE